MKTIITKIENNRAVKFLEIEDELAESKLEELLINYPDAVIYSGAYKPELYINNGEVSLKAIPFDIDAWRDATVVNAAQIRLALIDLGVFDAVENAVQSANKATQIMWEFNANVRRNNHELIAMAHSLKMSDEQIDDVFKLALTK